MRNLAGHPESTALFAEELRTAGIRAVNAEPTGETKAAVEGVVDLGHGFTLRVTRAWVYAVARIEPPLPVDAAREVNDTPCDIEGGRYSGERGTLGAVARADGFAGGLSSREIKRSVETWHIDEAAAVRTLVDALRGVIERRDLTATRAR